jgi:hypothetical protein
VTETINTFSKQNHHITALKKEKRRHGKEGNIYLVSTLYQALYAWVLNVCMSSQFLITEDSRRNYDSFPIYRGGDTYKVAK